MVMTVATVKDLTYYEKNETSKTNRDKESYYNENNDSKGYYHGKGADILNLKGNAEDGALLKLVNGKHPLNNDELFKFKEAKWQATDCCFSAPKDFTLLAKFDNENSKEYKKIFDNAVKTAIDYIHSLIYRKDNQSNHYFDIAPISIVYNHETARPVNDLRPDPQLHAHVITMRKAIKTNCDKLKFVSIDNYALFNNQKRAGAVFRAELSRGLKKLGFKIDRVKDCYNDENNKKISIDSFKVVGITDIQRAIFSNRSETLKDELGINATSLDKQNKILETRKIKKIWDKEELYKKWNDNAEHVGLTNSFIQQIKKIDFKTKILTEKQIIKKASYNNKLYENSLFLVCKEQEQYSHKDAKELMQEMIKNGLIKKEKGFEYSINFNLDSVKEYSKKFNRNEDYIKIFSNSNIKEVKKENINKSIFNELNKDKEKYLEKWTNHKVGTNNKINLFISKYSVEQIKSSIENINNQLSNPSLNVLIRTKLKVMLEELIYQLQILETSKNKINIEDIKLPKIKPKLYPKLIPIWAYKKY